MVSIVSLAGKFVLIPLVENNDLATLFKNKELKIHYYCDEFVLVTIENLTFDGTVILDNNAFDNDHSYAIVFCFDDYKEDYLTKISSSAKTLYSGENFLIMKFLSEGFVPANNDGMIMVKNKEAKMPKSGSNYPVITEIDSSVQTLIEMVNTDTLMATIQHLQDYGTRGYFKPQAYEAQEWIKAKFENMGLDVEIQYFSTAGNWLGAPDTSSANVIAVQIGTKYPDEYIVCGGHYDCGPVAPYPWYWDNCPGADDNASGTSGILETARILSQYEFERSIIYCCFSAEEIGIYGSDAYATLCSQQGMNIVGYFNLDMIGYVKQGNDIQINLFYPTLSKTFADYCINIYDIYFPEINVKRSLGNGASSDFWSFYINGYKAVFPHEFVSCPSAHSYDGNEDVIGVSVNSPEQVSLFTQTNVASVATIAKYDVAMPPLPLDADPPTNCFAEHLQDRKIKITWDVPIENTPKQYYIYRDGSNIAHVAATQSTYTNTLPLDDYDLHCYKITADYWDIESDFSNESCASVPNSIVEFNQKIALYPNPANDKLYIEGEQLMNQNIEIFDINGKNVANKIMDSNVTIIDISNITQGIYLIKISNEIIGKFVKK
jgi:hypothetical protein